MSVVEIIKHYQQSIEQNAGNLKRLLQCVTKLYSLPITVQHLQDTGVGRTVNSLRKYKGDCGEAAKSCVAKWKAMVAAEDSSEAEMEEADRSNGDYGKEAKHSEKSYSSSNSKDRTTTTTKKIVEDVRPVKDVKDHYGSVKMKERTAHSSSRWESEAERRERKAESSSSSSSKRKSDEYSDRKSRTEDKSRNHKKPNTGFSSPNYGPLKSGSPSKSSVSQHSSPSKSSSLSHKTTVPSSPAEPLDIEMPAISVNCRSLPNTFNPFDSPSQKKVKGLTDEEALSQIMYQKNKRTRVYSSVKAAGFRRGAVPTLFESCIHVLQDNIDALGYTGGVTYDILEPVLRRCTPDQLLELEHHNPYLVEDTDGLWEFHCKKQFRSMVREEMESYREMFLRGLNERAAKFETLTHNIKRAQAASVPVCKAKIAYVDSVAKPPREVARQQARNGTARLQPPGASCRSISAISAPRTPTLFKKKVMAPLMQKTMKFAKTLKR